MASSLLAEIKFKMAPIFRNYWMKYFLPATLTIIKILGHSKLDSLEAKGNYIAGISTRKAALKGTNSSQTSVIVQGDIFPNDNLEKLARKAQHLASEKEKTRWESQ